VLSTYEHLSDRPVPICAEDTEVLALQRAENGQVILKLQAPQCASAALPGTLVELSSVEESQVSAHAVPIMRADAERGWIEVLYRADSDQDAIANKRHGDRLSSRGPLGRAFSPNPLKPRALLVGHGIGVASIVFLAERLREQTDRERTSLVLLESDLAFPFRARPSTILVEGMPEGTIACMPMLDEWGIPSRLASSHDYPGCYEGSVVDLATAWLSSLDSEVLNEVEAFACGPKPMLDAIGEVAERFGVSVQLLLSHED
jgi:dihydroorotate dehydrogenase electron transfer subunit